ISSSCCVGMGVFSITPLKNKNPALGEGLSAIWKPAVWRAFFYLHPPARARLGARACACHTLVVLRNVTS
ncbi:hypothetical protein, partial [Burkholderia pseudomallei]